MHTFKLYIYILTSLLEYNCFTMVCQFLLYNKVNQLYVYIYPHMPSLLRLPPTLPIPSLQVVTKHRADLPVLCSCFPLAICFTFGSVYKSMPLSHFIQLPLPPLRVLKSQVIFLVSLRERRAKAPPKVTFITLANLPQYRVHANSKLNASAHQRFQISLADPR